MKRRAAAGQLHEVEVLGVVVLTVDRSEQGGWKRRGEPRLGSMQEACRRKIELPPPRWV